MVIGSANATSVDTSRAIGGRSRGETPAGVMYGTGREGACPAICGPYWPGGFIRSRMVEQTSGTTIDMAAMSPPTIVIRSPVGRGRGGGSIRNWTASRGACGGSAA